MSETTYLQFDHLEHPVALHGATDLMPLISDILAGWPHVASDICQTEPFVTIGPRDAGDWSLTLTETPASPRHWDSVNVICDLVAEMAWERLRSDPALLCLHTAAVEISGRLVIFPNARRAGKSILTAALGQLGHTIYTDDFLPVAVDPHSMTFNGIANGVVPRVRLPLPASFSTAFQAWVQQDTGPTNKQYKYLQNAPLARGGEMMPLGAMVVLDRQDTPTKPSLTPITRADALTTLIMQNFARTQVSGAILRAMETLARDLPVYCLQYDCAQEAATYLATHPALQSLTEVRASEAPVSGKNAPLDKLGEPAPEFVPTRAYIQARGLTETQVGDDHFLADRNGLAIYRLNAGSAAIWRILSQQTHLDEVIAILSAAFPDVPKPQIEADSAALMRNLVMAKLIVPASQEMAAQ